MSDLASLMQVAPISAAGMMGQQQQSSLQTAEAERQRLAELIQSLQIKNQFDQQNNPGLMEHQNLLNQSLRAKIPGEEADSRLKGTAADKAAGTLKSDIDVGNSNNDKTMEENKIKKMYTQAQGVYQAGVIAKQAEGQGPGAGQLAAKAALAKLGLPENHPLQQANPDQLMAYGQKMITHTEAYLQAIATQQEHNKGTLANAQEHSRGAMAVTQAQINAGRYDKKKVADDLDGFVKQQVLKAAGDPEKLYGIYSTATQAATNAGDSKKAVEYASMAMAVAKQAQSKNDVKAPPKVDMPAVGGLPATQSPQIASPAVQQALPGAGGPAPAGQAQRVRITGKDGKPYTVPANQLEEALKAGYTKAK
jgi:hypothetical protein